MTAFNDTFGIIGLSSENVGIDRRIYTDRTDTNPQLSVSYNGGRVDVYLNGVKLMGNHSGQSNYDYTYQSTGSGSSITLDTDVALVATDTIECVGYVSNSSNTVTTYTPSVSAGNNTFTSISHTSSDLLNVFLNGVLLDPSDYTADASADTVAITSLTSGDVVHIQVIGALDHSNFVPAGGGTFSGNVAVNGDLTVDTNTLKVDSANNAVFVGQTSGYVGDSASASGFRVQADGFLDVAKDGSYVMRVNRQTSDGEIVTLRKDGSSIGYIGTYGGDMTVGTGDTGIRFIDSLDCVVPVSDASGTSRDNAVDLGYSSIRYKDLHLGGNVVIGTAGKGIDFSAQTPTGVTGAAIESGGEVLDHYEEGTWTPTWVVANGTITAYNTGTTRGFYRKIGSVVYIWGYISFSASSGTSSGDSLRVGGLPFTSRSSGFGQASNQAGGVHMFAEVLWSNSPQGGRIPNNSNEINLTHSRTAGGSTAITVNDMNYSANHSQAVFYGQYLA